MKTGKRPAGRRSSFCIHHSSFCISARRGTAEIELILSVVVLLTVMFLALGAMRIAAARLSTARTANVEAFRNATIDATPMYTGDGGLPPVDGVGAVRPGLPNRTHVPRPKQDVSVAAGDRQTLPPVTVGGKAGTAGPPWTYSAYPVGGQDEADTEQWFLDDAAESHTNLTDPLRLAPAWTP
jgi:hypothetical protein